MRDLGQWRGALAQGSVEFVDDGSGAFRFNDDAPPRVANQPRDPMALGEMVHKGPESYPLYHPLNIDLPPLGARRPSGARHDMEVQNSVELPVASLLLPVSLESMRSRRAQRVRT